MSKLKLSELIGNVDNVDIDNIMEITKDSPIYEAFARAIVGELTKELAGKLKSLEVDFVLFAETSNGVTACVNTNYNNNLCKRLNDEILKMEAEVEAKKHTKQ